MFFIALISLFFLNYSPILASPRNIFGVHLTQTSDIHQASKIINSSGGDWGYTTIVARLDQLDKNTWQEFFNNCRTYHVIPIIRLGTIMEKDYWKRPVPENIDTFANFFNELNWPQKIRYIQPFNEINHSSEWGGEVELKSFVDIFTYTHDKFKSLNQDYFILSAPLDLAAPEKPPLYKSADNVYREIYNYNPLYFDSFDGISSHSYPNHGFVGLPSDSGRHSIKGFVWEQNFINSLGISKTYPVFITETGWPHREGESADKKFFTSKTTAKLLTEALQIWQSYPQVMAVSPFIYNFPYQPFDHFSWVDKSETLYPEYQQLIDLPKTKNIVSQTTSYQIIKHPLPWLIFPNKEYLGEITLKNTGQSIWGETKFCLKPISSPNITLDSLCLGDAKVLPNESTKLFYKFKINSDIVKSAYLGWEELGKFEIGLINGNPIIYQSKENFIQKIVSNIKSILTL